MVQHAEYSSVVLLYGAPTSQKNSLLLQTAQEGLKYNL